MNTKIYIQILRKIMEVLKAKNINKSIKNIPVIRDVSLNLYSGLVTGLKGINGSGKTMIMRALTGLISIDSGEIFYKNLKIGRDIDFPTSLGLLLENPSFFDRYTGFQNLSLLLEIEREINKGLIVEALQRVGLNPNDKRKYRQYSLGMKQRLGIAAAIQSKPELIILDEPFNSLDEEGVQQIKKIIKEESQRGAAILISCHDSSLYSDIVDNSYLVTEGRIIIEDKTSA